MITSLWGKCLHESIGISNEFQHHCISAELSTLYLILAFAHIKSEINEQS